LHTPATPGIAGGPIKGSTVPNPQKLGKDDFLKLLIAQLRNQDPLKPLEDKEFIVQLAQFNTLEQFQQMTRLMQDQVATQTLGSAAAFIGATVEATAPGEADSVVRGTVTGVKLVDGVAKLVVGNHLVRLSDVRSVGNVSSVSESQQAEQGQGTLTPAQRGAGSTPL